MTHPQRNLAVTQVMEDRKLAQDAVRACCARRKIVACMLTAEQALDELKDMSEGRLPHRYPQSEDEGRGVNWYRAANAHQRMLFKREWQQWATLAQDEEAERLRAEGVKLFREDWLAMNLCIKDAVHRYGMTGEQARANRTFLMGIAFRCCETFARKESPVSVNDATTALKHRMATQDEHTYSQAEIIRQSRKKEDTNHG